MFWHLKQNPNDVNGGQVQLPVGQRGCVSDSGFGLEAALLIVYMSLKSLDRVLSVCGHVKAGLKSMESLGEAHRLILPRPPTGKGRKPHYFVHERCWVILVNNSLRNPDQSLNKRVINKTKYRDNCPYRRP